MKIIIPGGFGQVGTLLARHFQESGREVDYPAWDQAAHELCNRYREAS